MKNMINLKTSKKRRKGEKKMLDSMEKIVNLCKARGYVYPGSDIYGGLSNTWDYGPQE